MERFTLVLILCTSCFAGCVRESTPPTTPLPTLVGVKAVQWQDSHTVLQISTGYAVPVESTNLAFEFSGKVTEIICDRGVQIKRNQVVAKQDLELLQTQRLVCESELVAARVRLKELMTGPRKEAIANAKADAASYLPRLKELLARTDRYKRLSYRGSVPRQEYEQVVAELQATQKQHEASEAKLEELKNGTRDEVIQAQRANVETLQAKCKEFGIKISKGEIVAPFDAVVAERFVDQGEVAGPTQPIVRLVRNDLFEAQIGVPAVEAKSFQQNQSVDLEMDGETISANVLSVLPQVDEATRTATIIVRFKTTIRPVIGRVVQLHRRSTTHERGFRLPLDALATHVSGIWSCFVVAEEDASQKISRVDLDVLSVENDSVFVSGNIKEGELVVVGGVNRLVNGQTVRVENE